MYANITSGNDDTIPSNEGYIFNRKIKG